MTNQRPITPPQELVQQWRDELVHDPTKPFAQAMADRSAQWGADQELEACIDWISVWHGLEHPELLIELLRAARRPKPPSLRQRALEALELVESDLGMGEETDTIRRALEQLDDRP